MLMRRSDDCVVTAISAPPQRVLTELSDALTAVKGEPQVTSLPRLTMILWGVGPVGAGTVLMLTGTQFLLYLTDYVAISPAFAGLILFVAKMSDAFTDVAVGLASDAINTRWGRRRPWLLLGTVVTAASCPLMFHVDGAAAHLRPIAATLSVIIFYTGYSAFYVPHQAMSAEMTQDYHERTSLVSWFYFFGTVSFVTGIAVAPELIGRFGGGIVGFHAMSWIIGVLPLITGLMCLIGTRGAPVRMKRAGPRTPMKVWIKSMVGNTPLMVLVASKLLHYFSVALLMTGLAYFTLYVLGLGTAGMSIAGFAMTGGSLLGLYFFLRLSKILQKHTIYALALFGMEPPHCRSDCFRPDTGRVVFAALCFVYGVAGAGLVMAQSMILDVLEWDHKRTGLRREGAVASLISAIGKATPAFASLLVGVLLSAFGYVPGHPGGQSAGALWAIRLCVSILPGTLLILAALLLYFFYTLTREKLEAGPAR